MNSISKFEKLISHLIKETINNNIEWDIQEPPALLTNNTENFYPLFLITEYRNKKIGLYEQRFKYYQDEDSWSWSERPGLCIFKDEYISYRYEKRSPTLKELFLKATEQASGIDELFD